MGCGVGSGGDGRSLEIFGAAALVWSDLDRLLSSAGLGAAAGDEPDAGWDEAHVRRTYEAIQDCLYRAIVLIRNGDSEPTAVDRETYRVRFTLKSDGSLVSDNLPAIYARLQDDASASPDAERADACLLGFALCMAEVEDDLRRRAGANRVAQGIDPISRG